MRSWVEKLANVIKKEGISVWLQEVVVRHYRIKLDKLREEFTLYVNHFNEKDEYYDKHVQLKIYPDEYDLLYKVIKDIEESEQDALIEIFNSFE